MIGHGETRNTVVIIAVKCLLKKKQKKGSRNMKVCPNCGHVDITHWRQNRWRTQVEFIELSEFKEQDKWLALDLESGHPFVTDKNYAYRLSGRQKWIVERVWIKLFEVGGKSAFHIPAERVNQFEDPWQTKLVNT